MNENQSRNDDFDNFNRSYNSYRNNQNYNQNSNSQNNSNNYNYQNGYYYSNSNSNNQSNYNNEYSYSHSYKNSNSYSDFKDFHRDRSDSSSSHSGHYNNKHSYKYRYSQSNQNTEKENFDPENFHIFRDPHTGKYYRVFVGRNTHFDPNNPYERKSNPYEKIYNTDPYHDEENEQQEMKIEVRHLTVVFTTLLVGLIFFLNLNNKKKAWDQNALMYKNQVYYPKNKDPIIDYMVNTKGYKYPREIYDGGDRREHREHR